MTGSIGKLEDAGQLVEGGRIDRYWDRTEIEIDPMHFTGNSTHYKAAYLYDPEIALQHFNLRSIEFGNWMSQEDRANFLYASMLGLHQLALLFGVEDKLIGLGGKLSIALGARGSGGAMGHYERLPYSVINITKPHGRKGVLAHEYAHALDNILSFYTKSKQSFVSGGSTTRKGYNEEIAKEGNYFEKKFEEFFNLLYFDKNGEKTAFNKALAPASDYWNERDEVFARTFEVYISLQQKKRKQVNTFLAPVSFGRYYPSSKLISGEISKLIEEITKRGFSLMQSTSKGLSGIDHPIVGYKGFRRTLKENASLDDTLENMKRIAIRDSYQVKELAFDLMGRSTEETARNLWEFIRENLHYKLDTEGIEELRTPSRTLHDRIFDCDDATILISAVLLNLGINHEYRITAYKKKGKFTHIYPVAFDENGQEYVIDTVPEIPHFGYEEQPIIDLKTLSMELHELSGVDPELSADQQRDLLDELNQPFSLSGVEDNDYDDDLLLEGTFLSGLEEVDNPEDAEVVITTKEEALQLIENGVLAEINKAIASLRKEQEAPTVISQTIDVATELDRLEGLVELWGNETAVQQAITDAIAANSAYKNFYLALKMSLEELDKEAGNLNGVEDNEPIYLARVESMDLSEIFEDESEEDGFLDEDDEEDDEDLSGRKSRRRRRKARRKRRRKFFKKVGKKVGKTLKKIGKAIVRFNPATIAVRNAILLTLKLNLFNISSRVIYGYLNRSQAEAKNMDLHEWGKVVKAKGKLEKFFTNVGGKSKNFRNAVIKGRAAKKTGVHLAGLGEAAAASTAAASGFIVFAKKILSAINPVKLFKKVATNIKERRLARRKTSPLQNNLQQRESAANEFVSSGDEPLPIDLVDEAEEGGGNANNPASSGGFMQRLKNIWTSHKKKLLIGGGSLVALIILIMIWHKYKKKKKRSLAGIKAARTRARNRKRQLKGLGAAPKRSTTTRRKSGTRRKTAPKSLGRGNTTVVRTPSKGRGKTRVYKQSSKDRLSLMHAKAKQLQKKHPKTEYRKLLSMASKQI
jgi:hypothetical protein